ncbi:hypothetical protein C8R46DRAFT_647360 [Mycena filopes]|nr:hypothetical protein C8R46DRAFT_306443 [Mycena filopes]KAJ7179758.1 hypothetical protein C8R46DRAFT_647360 [Mycena filopes]
MQDAMSTRRNLKRSRVSTSNSEEDIIYVDTRDDDYYFDDGDLVIRAGNTLFKVHKFLLSRDSSMFKDMFALPGAGKDGANASTDATALQVSDTVEAFRALLWVLYALPPELQAYLTNAKTVVELKRILSVAEITNKYHFTTLEAWSMEVVKSAIPSFAFTQPTFLLLARAMSIAERCSDPGLSDIVLTAWEGLLRSGVNPAQLINVLEEHHRLRSFSALTYYAQLSTMKIVRTGPAGSRVVTMTGCDGLSETQISRLLFGRWSLESEFAHLSTHPPDFSRGVDCLRMAHGSCKDDWRRIWLEAMSSKTVLLMDSADLLGRLGEVQKLLPVALKTSRKLRVDIHQTCREKISSAVELLIASTKRNLGDHFQLPATMGAT